MRQNRRDSPFPKVEALLTTLQPELLRMARRHASSLTDASMDAGDLLQEARFAIWSKASLIEDLDDGAIWYAWIVAHRTMVDALLAQRPPTRSLDAIEDIIGGDASAHGEIHVTRILGKLKPAEQVLLRETVLEGRSSRDLAAHYGVDHSTIRRRVNGALARLQAILAPSESAE